MQKGHDFERQIEKVCEYVQKKGGHAHKNQPARTAEGTYLKGEPFDYEIFIPGKHHVFDAKKSATDMWQMKKKDVVQADNLLRCKKAGLKAYFLILFGNKDVRQIDVEKVVEVLQSGKKNIDKSLGVEWELLEELRLWK